MTAERQTGLRVLIVDDEPLARNRLLALCERMENIGPVDVATGGHHALQRIEAIRPDLLLLDVDMPDVSGLDVAKLCRSMEHMPEIIFTTAHRKYAVEAFRLEATDYLLKPVKQGLLGEALGRVTRRLDARKSDGASTVERRIWVQGRSSAVQIDCADIGWVAAEGDYMRLNLPGRSYLIHESMRSLAERLPEKMFIRIHRSSLVQKDFIRDYRRAGRRKFVVLKDGTELAVGPRYAGGLGLSETVTE